MLPLVEYPRSRELFHELARAIDFEGVVSPGDAFPGWEFVVPMSRPRTASLLSFTGDPLVVIDEPEQTAAAAERLWKRLADPERETPISAEANFFRWGELQAQIANRTELQIRELELASFSHESLHISDAAVDGLSRQYAGGGGRGENAGGTRAIGWRSWRQRWANSSA